MEVLSREGYRVFRASGGKEAIEMARLEEIHGLIINMHMPDLSGIETLRRMRSENFRIPSILISSLPWKETQLEALEMGVFSFIQKPVGEDILKVSVARLLDRCCSEQSLRLSIQLYRSPAEETAKKNFGNQKEK